MTKEELISVVVPVYNSEKWLGRCIKSILNQSYKNIELILVNDGSEDNSKQICVEYKEKDNRIKLIDQKNSGVSAARNSGIASSCGKYLMFVDSDDFLEEKMINNMHDEIMKYDMCTCNYFTIINGNKSVKSMIDSYTCNQVNLNMYIEIMQQDMLFNSPCNKIYKLDIIKDNNLLFNKDIQVGEDYLFNIEYFKHVESASYINEPLYNYDIKTGSLSRKYVSRNIDNEFLLVDSLRTFYEDRGFDLSFIYSEYIELLKSNIYNLQIGKKSKKDIKDFIKEFINMLDSRKMNCLSDKMKNENKKIMKMVINKSIMKIYIYFSLRFMIKKIYITVLKKQV